MGGHPATDRSPTDLGCRAGNHGLVAAALRAPRRLPHVPGQPSLRGPGGVHPPSDPGGGGPRPLGHGVRRSALSRSRPRRGVRPRAQPRPLPGPGPLPGPKARGVRLRRRRARVPPHVHGRLPGAAHLQPPSPSGVVRSATPVRPGPRQPVPGHRLARDDGRRLAGRRHRPPSRHRRPGAGAGPGPQLVAPDGAAALLRLRADAGPGRAPPASRRHRLRVLVRRRGEGPGRGPVTDRRRARGRGPRRLPAPSPRGPGAGQPS
jgi:hypothetical protein